MINRHAPERIQLKLAGVSASTPPQPSTTPTQIARVHPNGLSSFVTTSDAQAATRIQIAARGQPVTLR